MPQWSSIQHLVEHTLPSIYFEINLVFLNRLNVLIFVDIAPTAIRVLSVICDVARTENCSLFLVDCALCELVITRIWCT